jgi:L-fuculokinase
LGFSLPRESLREIETIKRLESCTYREKYFHDSIQAYSHAKSGGTVAEELICVLDVGKTYSKIVLLDAETAAITWSAECESGVLAGGGFRQLDAPRVEEWFVASLASAPNKQHIRTIVPVAHGAAAALVDGNGRLLALPDYEDFAFDSIRDVYLGLRDPFSATLSPALPLGLNLGAQLFYLQSRQADLFAKRRAILLYPQYWAWRLSGVMTREVTSLGCHTDLWLPGENRFSKLAARQGWAELFPPMRQASDVLGALTPEIAAATGLDVRCRVLCGIHDSNASYLCHIAGWPSDRPLTVISSGTWTLVMSRGVALDRLRPELDMLANVDAFGTPVATARFMGGREYQAIAGTLDRTVMPDLPAVERAIEVGALALPSFTTAGGPFAGVPGSLINAKTLLPKERAALATLYVALMCDFIFGHLGTSGDIVVDGPFANNPVFAPLLAALRPGDRIRLSAGAGAAQGAFLLANSSRRTDGLPSVVKPVAISGLDEYRVRWRQRVENSN